MSISATRQIHQIQHVLRHALRNLKFKFKRCIFAGNKHFLRLIGRKNIIGIRCFTSDNNLRLELRCENRGRSFVEIVPSAARVSSPTHEAREKPTRFQLQLILDLSAVRGPGGLSDSLGTIVALNLWLMCPRTLRSVYAIRYLCKSTEHNHAGRVQVR